MLKSLTLFSLLVLCLPVAVFAQARTTQAPFTASTQFQDIYVDTNDTGWAVGTCSTVAKTTNGGQSWTFEAAPEGFEYETVACAPGSGCATVILGGPGVVARSTDGGTTWTVTENSAWNGLEKAHFPDANTAILDLENENIFRSTDAGATWSEIILPTPQGNTIQFVDGLTAFYSATSTNQMVKTTDAGANWEILTYDHPTSIRHFTFLDANTGWIFDGDQALYRTTDGGQTYSNLNQTGLPSFIFFITALSSDTLRGARLSTNIMESNDGGATWESVGINLGQGTRINAGYHRRGREFWLPSNSTEIYYSANNFTNWESQLPGLRERIGALAFEDDNKGYAFAQGGIVLKTTDGGMTWEEFNTIGFGTPTDAEILPNGDLLVMINGLSPQVSSDGGVTFVNYLPEEIDDQISGITEFTIAPGGRYYLAGFDQAAYSDDAGATWQLATLAHNFTASDVYFFDENLGFITGTGAGRYARTTDGGLNWTDLTDGSPTSQPVNTTLFTDANNGILFGGSRSYRTSDGGITWTSDNDLPGSYGWRRAPDGSIYTPEFASGNNGAVFRSTDNGDTWQQIGYTCNPYRSATITPSGRYFFAAGDGGLIERYDLDIASTVRTPRSAYARLQVAPNPTAGLVTFTLPESAPGSLVKVEVFDLQGRPVHQASYPANENLQLELGTYPRGTYIVRLKGDTWLQSGRVIRQ